MKLIKSLQILLAILALSMVTALPAFGLERKWLLNGDVIEAGKVAVDTSGELLLEDMGAVGKPDIVCSLLMEGTAGPGANDMITGIVDLEGKSPLKCTDKEKVCEGGGPLTVTPLHLPWLTELVLVSEKFRDNIVSGGSGEPGYSIDCNTILGLVTDVCEGASSSEEVNATGGVEAVFDAKSEALKCSVGGAGQGLLEGKLLTTTAESTLAVSEAATPEWLLNGDVIEAGKVAVDTSGELLLEDMGAVGKPDIVCSLLMEGTAGPGANDMITGIVDLEGKSPLKCTDKEKVCEGGGPLTVTPLHLPWLTELVLVSEKFRDNIVSGGSGEPGYSIDCNTILGLVTDVCEGASSSEEVNATGGVEAVFDAKSEALKCSVGGAGQGLLEGKLLTTTAESTLAVSEAATPEWLLNGDVIEAGKVAVDTSGELLLEDMGAVGKPDIVCSLLMEGTAGPGANDMITGIVDLEGKSPLKCTDKEKVCEGGGPLTVTPLHLPWLTELVLVSEKFRDNIVSGGSGEPGYSIDCNTILGLVTDVCEGASSSEEVNATGGVEAVFDAKSEALKCSVGGAGQGLLEGKLLTTTAEGTLAVSEE